MDVFEVIKQRRSIRKYREVPIDNETLTKILEAGRLSPSAVNRQPWNFIIIRDQAAKNRLAESYNREWFSKAPVILVVCATPKESWQRYDGEEIWKIDAAIALQSMILVATEEGLGTCWVCAFDEGKARTALGIPDEVRVVAMTPIGYPAEEKGPVSERKPLTEIVHWDSW